MPVGKKKLDREKGISILNPTCWRGVRGFQRGKHDKIDGAQRINRTENPRPARKRGYPTRKRIKRKWVEGR